MKDGNKTKKQLIDELAAMRQRIAELKVSEADLKRAEDIVKEAREYAENIVDTLREPLLVLDTDLRIISASRAFFQSFKVPPEDTIGQLLYDVGNRQWDIPPLRKLLEEVLPEKTTVEAFEVTHDFPDIGERVMILNARRIYRETNKNQLILLAIEDITERKELQERLIHTEKLAILGQLAGGVGHELRNPLGAIKNAAYFLNMVLEEPEPEVKETLEVLNQEVTTSERIISNLLGFARPKPPTKQKVNLNEVIQDVLSRAAIPENIEVVSRPGEKLPVVIADPDQLGQVFGNIILNGIQAMPEGGRLIVKSETAVPDGVAVFITDTGVGIPKKDMSKLFEPLFTTKAKGIGLGLALTRTLIEANGGTVSMESKAGKGSTFTVMMPAKGREEK